LGCTPAPPPAVHVPAPAAAHTLSSLHPSVVSSEHTRHGHIPPGASQGSVDGSASGSVVMSMRKPSPSPLMFVSETGEQS
jgi:hypothetical protein